MKTIKNLFKTSRIENNDEELKKSFAKVTQVGNKEDNFKTWFANIIYHSHPINKQMFE